MSGQVHQERPEGREVPGGALSTHGRELIQLGDGPNPSKSLAILDI